MYSLCCRLDALGLERYGTRELGFQILLVFLNIMESSKVLFMWVQLGNDMRFVLIFAAANYHQAIICDGGVRKKGEGERGEGGEKEKRRKRRRDMGEEGGGVE